MSLFHRLTNLVYSFTLTCLYIVVSIFDEGYLNFNLWNQHVTNVSILLFLLVMFILNLDLKSKFSIEEKLLEIDKKNLQKQLNELLDIKNRIDISIKNSLSRENYLNDKKLALLEKIESTKKNVSRGMKLKSSAIIDHYNSRIEIIDKEISNFEEEIAKKRAKLETVLEKIRFIEKNNKVT